MSLVCFGINHRTSPLVVREKLSFGKTEIPATLGALRKLPGVEEAVLLSTCNRVELYLVSSDLVGLRRRIEMFLQKSRGLPRPAFARAVYVREELDAVKHLMNVASGLDSQVIGEPQVLAQVKEAHATALKASSSSTVLNGVFNRSLAAAKRVRHETEIGRLPASVGSVAVELAERVFGEFAGRSVLLLGTGETSILVAEHLMERGRPRLLIAGERHHERARNLARRYGGEGLSLNEAQSRLAEADIAIVATASPSYLLTRTNVEEALARRRSEAMFLIDLSVPRNIEPSVGALDNAYLYNLDDLKAAASENLKRREQWLKPAGRIVDEALGEILAWLESLESVPTIVALQAHGEKCRQEVMARASRAIKSLPADVRAEVDYLTKALVAKILHQPMSRLRQAGARPGGAGLTQALRRLFGLG